MKSCFRDYMGDTCQGHHGCEVGEECFSETSFTKGDCECPHKRSCHRPRQYLQAKFKKENPSWICPFIECFEEDKRGR